MMVYMSTCIIWIIGEHTDLLPLQTMPTDMRALQDFEEPDKLKIHANDVITIIEGRSRDHILPESKTALDTLHIYSAKQKTKKKLIRLSNILMNMK